MADLDLASRIAHRDSYRDLGASSGTPWWEALEPRFAQQHERFDLTRADRLRIAATIPVDLALRRLGASAVGALAVPIGYRPSRVKQLLQDSDVYTRAADLGDPAAFFRRPTGPVTITRHRPPRPYFSPDGGRCWDLRFQSPFEPENPRERPDYLRHTRNRTAHAPTAAPSRTRMGLTSQSSALFSEPSGFTARGNLSLVRQAWGPTKTPSSIVAPW